MICIVNFGVGNVASILNMFRRLGIEACIASDPGELRTASKLVLPGVGSFDEGMRRLREHGFVDVLTELVTERKVPVLGICLGMQLMGIGSEEGSESGLGWLPLHFKRFRTGEGRQVKSLHMGWNEVVSVRPSRLLEAFERLPRFYFVHGYHSDCEAPEIVLATTEYGSRFSSVVARDNIFGVQFHPEKSHRYGMQLLRNFAERV